MERRTEWGECGTMGGLGRNTAAESYTKPLRPTGAVHLKNGGYFGTAIPGGEGEA